MVTFNFSAYLGGHVCYNDNIFSQKNTRNLVTEKGLHSNPDEVLSDWLFTSL